MSVENLDVLQKRTCFNEFITGYEIVNGTVLGSAYGDIKYEIDNFEVKDTDVWVCSYPKSGTTWTQEMVWLIVNNFDYEGAKMNLSERVPFIEIQAFRKNFNDKGQDFLQKSVEYVKELKTDRRLIKTHLPWNLLPKSIQSKEKRPKIIYVIRNPKDICVSFFYHYQTIEYYNGTFEEFCKLLLNDKILYSPYWNNINGYWEQRNESNVLIIRYEDMKKDLKSVAFKVAEFLGKNIPDNEMDNFLQHLTFNSMQRNPSINFTKNFIRKEVVGDFKNKMTEDQIEQFNRWIKMNNKFDISTI